MLNKEKQSVISAEGNMLVTANPGTGKTLLLAHKYLHLIKNGTSPENILCLTFTEKAKREMEERILKVSKEENVDFDASKLNVYTFHSYALENIEEKEILSTNLLRYTIFSYLRENEILNYSDDYLLDKIVPKMENLIRYLKSFGITPEEVDIDEVRKRLEKGKNYTKEEIDRFAEDFVAIYRHYEEMKNLKGIDYADMLIKFLKLREIPHFEYVLVDELQDVNIMEADIALKSGEKFVAVGDKKQAIFGFQGGSILNFEKFSDSKHFVLSENYRTTNEILAYAREYFSSKTGEESHKEELKNLRNAENKSGEKPVIYDVGNDDVYAIACEIVKGFSGKTAIITRANNQIMNMAKELEARGMDFSSTFFSASDDAKNHIITFLRGVLSYDVQDVINSMFTPFFPCSLQDAFRIAEGSYADVSELLEELALFRKIREEVKNVEDVNILFRDRIMPICISYGKEYVSAAISMQKAYQEAIATLPKKNMHSFLSYLRATDLKSEEFDVEKDIMLTTVHKAKGKEFDNVIYIPAKTRDKSNFQDRIVEAILASKGIDVKEELEEETLRINFVAFTRAKENLVILADKVKEYLNDYARLGDAEAEAAPRPQISELKHRAFGLFVNGEIEEAKKLLDSRKPWIRDYIRNYFESLDHISFSSLPETAYDYFVGNILGIGEAGFATTLGTRVHEAARHILTGEGYEADEEAEPFIENVKKIIAQIDYDDVQAELKLEVPLSLLGFDSDIRFKSFLDAVFRKGDEYLIVDWKTSKNAGSASKYRQQLEVYRRVFAASKGVPPKKIRVAIGFVGLRSVINTGRVEFLFDDRQPARSAFATLSKRIEMLLSWIRDPDQFFRDFLEREYDDLIWRYVVEEWGKEKIQSQD
ncbi:MAG: ATP-dependent helicase [Candidatus Micrarchaeota archaeon]|nr:ATP-dependent helicase [Candidatus Micrarchaeota archaeon]